MLERLAMDLKANSKDGWSFVETEGTVTFGFCRWVEEEEWDGDVETVRSLWRPERLTLIERGEAEPDEKNYFNGKKRIVANWLTMKISRPPHLSYR